MSGSRMHAIVSPEDVEKIPKVLAPKPIIKLPDSLSAADLLRGTFIPPRPLLIDLLWDGLTLLIAKAKTGKSWTTLQLAVQIAGGRKMPGVTALDHGPVLYLALEEPQARTMLRLRKVCDAGEWAERLHFVYNLLPLMGGGAEQLEALIDQIKPRLVVIDTLTAVIGAGGGKRDSDVFRGQYAEVTRIRKITEGTRTAIILIHHVRKGMSDGAIEAVAGTGGIAAAVDSLWYLRHKPEGEATMEVIGREAEDRTWAMRFDQEPFGWSVLGDDAANMLGGERREVLTLLREDGGLTPAQIAAELGKSRPAVRQLLKRMRDDEQLTKQGQKYIPSISMSHRVTDREKE